MVAPALLLPTAVHSVADVQLTALKLPCPPMPLVSTRATEAQTPPVSVATMGSVPCLMLADPTAVQSMASVQLIPFITDVPSAMGRLVSTPQTPAVSVR